MRKIFGMILWGLTAGGAGIAQGPVISQARPYKVVPLGPVSSLPEALANAVNSHRVVVGSAGTVGAVGWHGALWKPSAWPVDIGSAAAADVSGTGLNDAGVVVGQSRNVAATSFVWDPNRGTTWLPSPPNLFANARISVSAYQINSSGYIPGSVDYEFPNQGLPSFSLPMLWRYNAGVTTWQLLPDPNPLTPPIAFAISDADIVGGTSDGKAAVWDIGNGLALRTLGTLPGHTGGARVAGLDSKGAYAAGSADAAYAGTPHAFIAFLKGNQSGKVQQIGDPVYESRANAVNSQGQTVGYSFGAKSPFRFAFLWDESQGFQDLNNLIPSDSHWRLLEATGINDHGEIVGNGWFQPPGQGIPTLQAFMLVEDTNPPATNCHPADGQWHSTNVPLACTANDAIAGLANPADIGFQLGTSVTPGTETANAATESRKICDAVGNCSIAGPVTGNRIDRKAPTITCGSADGKWHAANVIVACDAQDGGSGVANPGILLLTSVPAGIEDPNASTGPVSACDRVLNCTVGPPVTGNKVDRKPPLIALTFPSAGSVYLVGEKTFARYSCADFGSGLASCTGDVPADTLLPTNATGPFHFAVKALDKVGNNSQSTSAYSVTWGICSTPQSFRVGSVAKIQITLCDAGKTPASGRGIAVTATGLSEGSLQGQPAAFQYSGNGTYEFDLDTRNFAVGAYDLQFGVARDPIAHHVAFQLVPGR